MLAWGAAGAGRGVGGAGCVAPGPDGALDAFGAARVDLVPPRRALLARLRGIGGEAEEEKFRRAEAWLPVLLLLVSLLLLILALCVAIFSSLSAQLDSKFDAISMHVFSSAVSFPGCKPR